MGIAAPIGVASAGLPPPGDQANAVLTGLLLAVGPTQPFAFRGPMDVSIWADINTVLTTGAGSTAATVGSATGLAVGDSINSVNVPRGTTVGALTGTNVTLAIPAITLHGLISTASGLVEGLESTDGLLGAAVTVSPGFQNAILPAGTTVVEIIQVANLKTNTKGKIRLSTAATFAPANNYPLVPLVFQRNGNAISLSVADVNALFTGAAIVYDASVQLERSFDGGATWLVCNVGGFGSLAAYDAGTPVSLSFGEPEKNVLYRLNCTAYTGGRINYRISTTGEAATSLAVPSVI